MAVEPASSIVISNRSVLSLQTDYRHIRQAIRSPHNWGMLLLESLHSLQLLHHQHYLGKSPLQPRAFCPKLSFLESTMRL